MINQPESKTQKFVVVGRAGMDLYPEPIGTKIENAASFSAQLGGSAANIAVGLARMEAKASLVTALSDDPVGRYCRNMLQEHGVDVSFVQTSGTETRSSLALSESRVEDHETLIYRNGAADFDLSPAFVNSIDLSKATALVVTGTAMARQPSREAVFALIQAARDKGIDVVLDVDYRPYSWTDRQEASEICLQAARQSTIVVGNDEEFAVLWGEEKLSTEHGRKLTQESGAMSVYKMGKEGSITFDGGREMAMGVFPVQALKPVGAGDAFLASFLAAHFSGHPLAESVMRGSAAAALVVTRKGCSNAMPKLSELVNFMQDHEMTPVEAVGV